MKIKKVTAVMIALAVIMLVFSGCEHNNPIGDENQESKTQFVLGTTVTIQIYGEHSDEIFSKVFGRLRDIEDKMTINRDGSEVMSINENAGREFVKVSDDTYYVIKRGVEFSEVSNGKFDISIGPLVKLWNIGTESAKVPSEQEIEFKKTLVDYTNVEIDHSQRSIKLKDAGMILDLGGIAKGYAADEIISLLRDNGVERAIVNIGGNIFAHGKKPDGSDWNIGIQNPFSKRGDYLGIVSVHDKTVVTSGIYERFFEEDGVRYHHILDPDTGYPVENELAGVSIVADKSIEADALSTAVFSLGVSKGMELIEEYEGADAIFITRDNDIYITSGIKNVFSLTDDKFEVIE